jgi:cell division protein FtsB
MRELEHRQKMKRRLYSYPALGALVIMAIALGRGAYLMMEKERESSREAAALEANVLTLSSREAELKQEIEKLETPSGIEEEIKSKFNVAREGESVAIIVDPKALEATTTPEEESWFKRFLGGIISR